MSKARLIRLIPRAIRSRAIDWGMRRHLRRLNVRLLSNPQAAHERAIQARKMLHSLPKDMDPAKRPHFAGQLARIAFAMQSKSPAELRAASRIFAEYRHLLILQRDQLHQIAREKLSIAEASRLARQTENLIEEISIWSKEIRMLHSLLHSAQNQKPMPE